MESNYTFMIKETLHKFSLLTYQLPWPNHTA